MWDYIQEYARYEQSRIMLCDVYLKDDIQALELVKTMDTFVIKLLESYENLDPQGLK